MFNMKILADSFLSGLPLAGLQTATILLYSDTSSCLYYLFIERKGQRDRDRQVGRPTEPASLEDGGNLQTQFGTIFICLFLFLTVLGFKLSVHTR